MSNEEQKLVGFGSYTVEAAEQEKVIIDQKGTNFFSFEGGRNQIRILPGPEGSNTPFTFAYTHFVGEEIVPGIGTKVFACPRRMSKNGSEPCPVCSKGDQLRNSGDKDMAELAKKFYARKQWYFNMIDRKNPDKGVQVGVVGKTIMEQINQQHQELMADSDDPVDFTHPLHGIDLIVERVGTDKEDTKYRVSFKGGGRKSMALALDEDGAEDYTQMNEWLQGRVDLTEKAIPWSAERIRNELKPPAKEDAELGGGEAPKQISGGSSRKQRSAPEQSFDASDDDGGESSVDW